jgi:hypothetical protein
VVVGKTAVGKTADTLVELSGGVFMVINIPIGDWKISKTLSDG